MSKTGLNKTIALMKALWSYTAPRGDWRVRGRIASAFGAGAFLNGVSGNGMFSMLTTGQLFRTTFEERNIPRNVLSRSMENSMTLLESLLPWHVTAVYMYGALGVLSINYMFYSFFNVIGILMFFVLVMRDLRKRKYETKAPQYSPEG